MKGIRDEAAAGREEVRLPPMPVRRVEIPA